MRYLFLTFVCLFNLILINTSYANTHIDNNVADNTSAKLALQKKLIATESLSGNFTQTTQDKNGIVLQESKGNFSLATPGLFYWETTQPYENKIIVRNKKVVMLDPELEQASVRVLNGQGDQFLVSLLTGADKRGAITALNNFQITQNKNQFNLIANPDNNSQTENNLVSEIHLIFDAKKNILKQINFINALDQTTIIDFSNLVANKKIDLSLFDQPIPEGYDTVSA